MLLDVQTNIDNYLAEALTCLQQQKSFKKCACCFIAQADMKQYALIIPHSHVWPEAVWRQFDSRFFQPTAQRFANSAQLIAHHFFFCHASDSGEKVRFNCEVNVLDRGEQSLINFASNLLPKPTSSSASSVFPDLFSGVASVVYREILKRCSMWSGLSDGGTYSSFPWLPVLKQAWLAMVRLSSELRIWAFRTRSDANFPCCFAEPVFYAPEYVDHTSSEALQTSVIGVLLFLGSGILFFATAPPLPWWTTIPEGWVRIDPVLQACHMTLPVSEAGFLQPLLDKVIKTVKAAKAVILPSDQYGPKDSRRDLSSVPQEFDEFNQGDLLIDLLPKNVVFNAFGKLEYVGQKISVQVDETLGKLPEGTASICSIQNPRLPAHLSRFLLLDFRTMRIALFMTNKNGQVEFSFCHNGCQNILLGESDLSLESFRKLQLRTPDGCIHGLLQYVTERLQSGIQCGTKELNPEFDAIRAQMALEESVCKPLFCMWFSNCFICCFFVP